MTDEFEVLGWSLKEDIFLINPWQFIIIFVHMTTSKFCALVNILILYFSLHIIYLEIILFYLYISTQGPNLCYFIVGFILLRLAMFLIISTKSELKAEVPFLKWDIKWLVENYLNSPKIKNNPNGFSRCAYKVLN